MYAGVGVETKLGMYAGAGVEAELGMYAGAGVETELGMYAAAGFGSNAALLGDIVLEAKVGVFVIEDSVSVGSQQVGAILEAKAVMNVDAGFKNGKASYTETGEIELCNFV